ncbi:inorganic phosphate transporter [Aerosakkonema funiforme]|uniref:Phosphate transporter n=2 Tax=Oscillatoriophycideae TaxID=1301283 RepID=A0A926VLT0_9CYAN|nr:inorganic phosphate transporter [Aerosakkonema funiforme]MBD2186280.1 inorganic phosphate transporter [Aerosakkonema funiforme FACHB-1375]
MIVFVALLAFYLAWNLGANDVANSMGTSVGSKAITLAQALIIAGILEFTGAVLFGGEVSETLATEIVNPATFASTPQTLLIGMVSVLISCGLWLQIATSLGLPVSSSHATVGAIAGFSWIAAGINSVEWSSIGTITIGWVLTPVISGSIASLFYSIVKRWILDRPHPIEQLREWIPWLSAALLSVFGVIVLPTLTQPVHAFLTNRCGVNLPAHDITLVIGAIAAVSLSLVSWRQLESGGAGENSPIQNPKSSLAKVGIVTGSGAIPILGSPQVEDMASKTPTSRKIQNPIERQLGRFQVLSACFVAFAHGSNDVGNAIAPLAAISYIRRTGSVPLGDFSIPLWILVLGGLGIVAGLAVLGKNVITTVGENIIPLQPSGGFCAELATATTVLLASRLGLPVSTSHALVGGVIGIGLVQNWRSIRITTLRSIAGAWVITIPITASLGATIFAIARLLLPQL